MSISFSKVEELLPGYLSGELSDKDRAIVENWRAESPEHEMLYCESLKAWEALSLLNEMEQFNSFEALNAGVKQVVITRADLIHTKGGTKIVL